MRKPDGTWERVEEYVIDFALDRMRAGERVALVTLVQIEGSSPRPLGSQMAVSESGDWVGYLSGGCIERAIVAEALAAIEQGSNRRVRYGRGSKYLDIQLPCGSAIELVLDVNVSEGELAAIDLALARRQAAALRVPGGSEADPHEAFIRHYYPRRRLIVAGVGPAAIQLARLGRLSGFESVLFSPDEETRNAAEGEGVLTVVVGRGTSPDFQADSRSAIVLMFHDHDWEKRLIPAALQTPAFYIGAMGSRRTQRQRMEMLELDGVDPVQLGRIKGPAGLFSGAKTASDVAVSVLAEVMQMERGANVAFLSCEQGSVGQTIKM
ncbi:XdhC family protein [Pseudaminobacter arsenicus]|uniref:XdhC family protein n=1 Tax=Borborobacter arsenicus TaxID=1851146 RepID=A0A432V7U1_9HYPH|nr:XdhC family protein [Pseudaminobacter arsenicus]RUM98200.1 XdhC family protein [Pseudaminobacter arsenicus]